MEYIIKPRIDSNDPDIINTYSVYDFFPGIVIDQRFATMQDADLAAHNSYRGPDVDGVGCTWTIAKADDAR